MSALRECPLCRQRYRKDEDFCGTDGARLVEMAAPDPVPDPVPALRAATDPDGLVGQVLAGRFLLLEVLGQSEAALVYRATHKVLERDFAVKILLKGAQRDRRALSRFLREAKVASSVDHPNIVTIYDFGQSEGGDPYLVMEYADGVSLSQAISKSPGGRLPVPQALDVALQVARALEHAHSRGVVHRNIKPENVALVHRDGHSDFVKLLDLGVARIVGQPGLTQKGEIVGTAEFIAPEAWSEEATEVAPPMDLYALGILLHCTIAGRPPFIGERGEIMLAHLHDAPPPLSAHSQNREVPRDLDALVGRLLDKDPARRPTAEEAVSALEQIQAQLPPQSLRSLLLQKTLILPPKPPAEKPRWQQETVLSNRAARETRVRERTEAQVEPYRPPLAPTLGQIDVLEAELERTRRRLADSADSLLERLWPVRPPPEPEALRAHIGALEETEEMLGIQLAVTEEALRQREHEVHERRAALRQQILALSERLRPAPDVGVSSGRIALEASGPVVLPLTGEERKEVLAQLMEAERGYAAAGQEDDGGLRAQRDQEREQLQAVRGDMHGSWLRLGRLVVAGATPELAGEARRVEQLIEQLEAAAAALGKLMQQAQRLV